MKDWRSPEHQARLKLERRRALYERKPHPFNLRQLERAKRRYEQAGQEAVKTHDH